jgi:CRISPR-associated protein Cas5d
MGCFTRPEMKVERVSYEAMTPAAARGILESILWKPAIEWQIHAIEILAPIRWVSFTRNEIQSKATIGMRPIVADRDRTQRHTLALRDVDYVIRASFSLSYRATQNDSLRKFEEIFERRLVRGQHFNIPYLGCREFPAAIEAARTMRSPVQLNRSLGWMFYDFDWSGFGVHRQSHHLSSVCGRALFFEAQLQGGVIDVPSRSALPNASFIAQR